MTEIRRRFIAIAAGLLLTGTAGAQTSPSFKLEEHTLNLGGHPIDGQPVQSASFTVSLGALGDGVTPAELSSASFRSEPGFVVAFAPPGEVAGLRFDDVSTLSWNADPAAGSYNMYRDLLGNLSGLGYGDCLVGEIAGTSSSDGGTPPVSDGWFYLVTSRNRLDEEGTKGFDSALAERPNPAPCP